MVCIGAAVLAHTASCWCRYALPSGRLAMVGVQIEQQGVLVPIGGRKPQIQGGHCQNLEEKGGAPRKPHHASNAEPHYFILYGETRCRRP